MDRITARENQTASKVWVVVVSWFEVRGDVHRQCRSDGAQHCLFQLFRLQRHLWGRRANAFAPGPLALFTTSFHCCGPAGCAPADTMCCYRGHERRCCGLKSARTMAGLIGHRLHPSVAPLTWIRVPRSLSQEFHHATCLIIPSFHHSSTTAL